MLIIFSCQQKSEVPKTYESLHAVLWMQRAAEYKALSIQAYRLAEMQLQLAMNDKNWTAALEQIGDYQNLPLAVVLDVDETVLDNSPFEAELIMNGESYSSKSWNAWCNKASAEAVPGALKFCQNAKSNGVIVFYVTNRRNEIRESTRSNLQKLGFPLEENIDTILPRLESSDKGTRREIVSENYRILLLIGDNLGDFASGFTNASMDVRDSLLTVYKDYFGKKWISLANPVYGDWEGAIYDYNYGLSDEEKLEIKFNSLIRK
jgi:acid phosphatase